MQATPSKLFNNKVSGLVPYGTAQFSTIVGIRSLNSSNLSITVNNNQPRIVNGGTVSGKYDDSFISGPISINDNYTLNSEDISVNYTYNKTQNESAAWIDYFLLVTKRNLAILDNQQIIRNASFGLSGNAKYQLANFNTNTLLWDVTDLYNIKVQSTFSDGDKSAFIVSGINASIRC